MKILFQYLKVTFLFLAVFEISRLYFVLYNASYFDRNLFFTFAQTSYKGFWLDLSAVAYCLLPFLLMWLCERVVRRKSPSWLVGLLLVIELSVIFLITISDAELYVQWGNKFNNQVLVYISHPREMALSAGATNWLKTLVFSAFTVTCIYFIARKIFKIITLKREYKYQQIIVVILLIGVNFIMLRGGVGIATISQSSAIYSTKSVNNAASVNSMWNAFYYLVNNTEDIYGKWYVYEDEKIATESFDRQIRNDKEVPFVFSKGNRPNVIIVILESFTSSASRYFSGRDNCMPYLDSLARQNLSFMQCYASGDRTDKGLVAILSGYPAQPASSIITFPDKVAKLPSIGKSLQGLGYDNTFIYGGDAEYAQMKSYLMIHGFKTVIDKKHFSISQLTSKWGAHDGDLYNKSTEVLQGVKQPFFTVILSLSSHEPFDVPYASVDIKKDEWYGFKNSIRYADKCLHDFLETCKKQPWYDNTIVLLVADHGHDIGLKDIFYFGKEKYHIPLVIAGGALKEAYKGMQVTQVVSQTIVPNLLLQNLGVSTEAFRWQTDIHHPEGFAQYHYNNGFGRVNNRSQGMYENAYKSYYFLGEKADSVKMNHDGRIFQQILIDDFLKK